MAERLFATRAILFCQGYRFRAGDETLAVEPLPVVHTRSAPPPPEDVRAQQELRPHLVISSAPARAVALRPGRIVLLPGLRLRTGFV